MTDILVRELSRPERPALETHLLALGGEDRRLRFGAAFNDAAVSAYVERIDFERDALFGVFDDALHLTGAAHVARSGAHAELGVSVLEDHRGRGIGGALLARAHLRARNWGVRALFNNIFDTVGYDAYRSNFIDRIQPRNFSGVVTYKF